jgi:hypothetical protein
LLNDARWSAGQFWEQRPRQLFDIYLPTCGFSFAQREIFIRMVTNREGTDNGRWIAFPMMDLPQVSRAFNFSQWSSLICKVDRTNILS